MIHLDPNTLGQKEIYKLLIGAVVPRPIATVSTMSSDGKTNVAPFSFYNAVSSAPPCISIAIARNSKGGKKDTLANIESTGEFVVNATPVALAEKINQASGEYPPGVSEFEATGLTPTPSLRVKPPRVLESPLAMECVLEAQLELGKGQQGSTTLIIGRIVAIHVSENVWKEGRIQCQALDPLSRLGGLQYGQTSGIFELSRPIIP